MFSSDSFNSTTNREYIANQHSGKTLKEKTRPVQTHLAAAFANDELPLPYERPSTKNPAHLSMNGVSRTAFEPYGAYVSNSSVGTLKSRDIMTLNAVMVKIENTNSLRAQTVSSTAL